MSRHVAEDIFWCDPCDAWRVGWGCESCEACWQCCRCEGEDE